MKYTKLFYFTVGGILILTSAIAFIYFTLFGYKAAVGQWISAGILGLTGAIFLAIGDGLEGRSR